MITVRPIKLADTIDAAMPMIMDHIAEIGIYEGIEVDPDREKYIALDDAGVVIAFGAFLGDALVGYCVSFILSTPHSRGLNVCLNDLCYLAPEFRKTSRAALDMVRATEQEAKRRGAKKILWNVRLGTKMMKIIPRLGYDLEEMVFSKEL